MDFAYNVPLYVVAHNCVWSAFFCGIPLYMYNYYPAGIHRLLGVHSTTTSSSYCLLSAMN